MQYINRIVNWYETWSMKLIPEKCKIMHLGKHTKSEEYLIAVKKIGVTER